MTAQGIDWITSIDGNRSLSLSEAVEEFKRLRIHQIPDGTDWNQTQAAKLLALLQ